MDMPSSAPAGGLIDRAVSSLDFGQAGSIQESIQDQAKFLHAGSPWFLALTALGVVFGDIGTSPLYAFQVALTGLGHPVPTAAEVLGLVSLILWALMVMVSLKYVVFVLRADNDGEGGILALLSLVASDQIAKGARLPVLVLLGVIGASLLYGDGVITPAISVLSAMEGLKLVAPSFEHFILPATIAVLDRIVRHPAAWHRTHRQTVRTDHGGVVRRDRRTGCGQHLHGAGHSRLPSIQPRPRASLLPIPRSPSS